MSYKRKTWREKLADDKGLPKVTPINQIRAALAQKHRADFACPITTGIFAWIAAHAAEEARSEGRKRITPWWRTLKGTGNLNPKFPGGIEMQARFLQSEGHVLEQGPKNGALRLCSIEGKLVTPTSRA